MAALFNNLYKREVDGKIIEKYFKWDDLASLAKKEIDLIDP